MARFIKVDGSAGGEMALGDLLMSMSNGGQPLRWQYNGDVVSVSFHTSPIVNNAASVLMGQQVNGDAVVFKESER
jgi:hypothetical protein